MSPYLYNYYVDSLEEYDQVYRAVAFFIHKYGRIDWPSMGRYVYMARFKEKSDMESCFDYVLSKLCHTSS